MRLNPLSALPQPPTPQHTPPPACVRAARTQVLVLAQADEAAGITRWRLADVRANAPVKGRKLSKRQREMTFDIPLAAITRVRVHVDF
jgi:hypothetical protein